MKKLLLSAVLAASFVALSANAATTSSGTITVTGKVVSSTCNVTFNGVQSPTITLPTYDTNTLTSGVSAGWTPVTMALTGCAAVTSPAATTVFPYFTGSNIDTVSGYLKNATGAGNSNVEIAFSTTQSLTGALSLNQGSGAQGAGTMNLTGTGSNASVTYYAGYVAYGANATAGNVNTNVQYALNYQ